METQTRLSRHNKFISAENIVGIYQALCHKTLVSRAAEYIDCFSAERKDPTQRVTWI